MVQLFVSHPQMHVEFSSVVDVHKLPRGLPGNIAAYGVTHVPKITLINLLSHQPELVPTCPLVCCYPLYLGSHIGL